MIKVYTYLCNILYIYISKGMKYLYNIIYRDNILYPQVKYLFIYFIIVYYHFYKKPNAVVYKRFADVTSKII